MFAILLTVLLFAAVPAGVMSVIRIYKIVKANDDDELAFNRANE